MFLEISQNSQENTCARVSFLIKLQASAAKPAALLKKRLWYMCFPVNLARFLRTPFLQNTSGRLFVFKIFDYRPPITIFPSFFIPHPIRRPQKQSFTDVLPNRCSKKFRKFHRNHLCRSLFLKRNPSTGVFVWNLPNFLRTCFFTEHLR